jgi:DNA-binding NtrC family response regulator
LPFDTKQPIADDQGSRNIGKLTLLVIDDQRIDRLIAAHAPTAAGYEVTSAASIAEVDTPQDSGRHYDAVMVDLILGREDGLQILYLVARHMPTPPSCSYRALRTGCSAPASGLPPHSSCG